MQQLPETENALVLRTDFTDDTAWRQICASILEPFGEFEFQANVDFLDNPEYEDTTAEQVSALIPPESNHTFMFIIDEITFTFPENTILVVDLAEQPGRSFRTVPSEMWNVENNLSLANMDFEEFSNSVDSDNIFRGFPQG